MYIICHWIFPIDNTKVDFSIFNNFVVIDWYPEKKIMKLECFKICSHRGAVIMQSSVTQYCSDNDKAHNIAMQ